MARVSGLRPVRTRRLTLSRRVASRGLTPWALGALAAAQVAYGLGSRPPKATRAIVALMLATSALEARRAGDGRAVAAAGAVGFAAELVGVATGRPFGHYSYSSQLGPRVGGVPLLAAAAWAMMARPAWVTAGRLSARRSRRIVLAAGALTAWDVFLDPRMAREGYWTWPGGGRYEGVPGEQLRGLVRHRAVPACFAAPTPRCTRAGAHERERRRGRWRSTCGPGWASCSPTPRSGSGRGWPWPVGWRWARSPCRRCGGDEGRGRGGRRRRARGGDRAGRGRPPRDGLRAERRARRQVRARLPRRLHLGRRAVAADDAVGLRRPRCRAPAGRAGHALPLRRREQRRAVRRPPAGA